MLSKPPTDLPDELRTKRDRLLTLLGGLGRCAVAFSGGLDSAVLAAAAARALGDRAVAVTALSGTMVSGELEEAVALAKEIGIRHVMVATTELDDPAYQANTAQRCYHCRKGLFTEIRRRADELGLDVVVDGSNRDDAADHRPGRRAARESGVRSPLAECDLSKAELRWLASHWGLPVWNKPSTPCLSSRIAYGVRITPERLNMVDEAEGYLREQGFSPLRVRHHEGEHARIEVASDALARFLDPDFRAAVVARLKSLGYRFVSLDLEPFRTGSLNVMLRPEELERGDEGMRR